MVPSQNMFIRYTNVGDLWQVGWIKLWFNLQACAVDLLGNVLENIK
jgi:hypothetical protein